MTIYFFHSFYSNHLLPPVTISLAPGWICLTHPHFD